MNTANELSNVQEEIISVRPDSVVVRVEGGVDKSYLPKDFQEWQERYRHVNPFSEMTERQYRARQRELFYHEWAIVKALWELDNQVIPTYKGADHDLLRIHFADVDDYPRYQDVAEEIWAQDDIDYEAKQRRLEELTEEMVLLSLIPYHQSCNAEMTKLVRHSRTYQGDVQVRLKARKPRQQRKRLRKYFDMIFYSRSSELQDFWESKGINPDDLSLEDLHKHLNYFGRSYQLNERLIEMVKLNRRIKRIRRGIPDYGFVAGDFRMQNVFRTQDSSKVLVFDFDKTRRGSRNIDLYHAINNSHRFPFNPDRERVSLEIAAKYFRSTGFDGQSLPHRLASYVGTGILEEPRWWAVHFQLPPRDFKQFFGQRKEFEGKSDEEIKAHVVDAMFPQHFRDIFNYYRYQEGEGWEEVLRKPLLFPEDGIDQPTRDERKELLEDIRRQFRTVEDILKETGCLQGQATSKRRAQRIRAIFS